MLKTSESSNKRMIIVIFEKPDSPLALFQVTGILIKFISRCTGPQEHEQGGNSQRFLSKIHKIFVTLRSFYGAVIHRTNKIYDFSSS